MERYTPQAKEALSLAVGMAESLNHGYVGTEHLLIGLLQEGTGVAARVLEENGVEESKVVELVSQLISPNTSVQMAENAAYTPRARRVIENSYREAVRFKAAQIGTEHILIAILREGDCVASRLLNTVYRNYILTFWQLWVKMRLLLKMRCSVEIPENGEVPHRPLTATAAI